MDEEYDVIIVGAGIAGSICATLLAREGHSVVLIERAGEPGEKNLSGGIFYSRIMEDIFPNFLQEAPIERRITRNVVMFTTPTSHIALDYADSRLGEHANAVSVLRSKFDPWLSAQAEEAGAFLVPGMKVSDLIIESGKVCGVRAEGEELRAKVVVAADGINSFLSHKAKIRAQEPKKNLGLGIKSVWKLPQSTIEDRFHVRGSEGAAYAIVGDATHGIPGGGFLYTNADSLSLGIVIKLDALTDHLKASEQAADSAALHDYFASHPAIAPLLEGAQMVEYGCHLVAEGGKKMQHDLVRDGYVCIGDAAGFTLNTGLTIRGMDLAAGSAQCAARAIHEALNAADTSSHRLRSYEDYLSQSFVGQDMATYAQAPDFLDTPELYHDLGFMAEKFFYDIYNHDLSARKKLYQRAWEALRSSRVSPWRWIQIAWKGVNSL